MKETRNLTLLIQLFIFLVFSSGCKKDDDNSDMHTDALIGVYTASTLGTSNTSPLSIHKINSNTIIIQTEWKRPIEINNTKVLSFEATVTGSTFEIIEKVLSASSTRSVVYLGKGRIVNQNQVELSYQYKTINRPGMANPSPNLPIFSDSFRIIATR